MRANTRPQALTRCCPRAFAEQGGARIRRSARPTASLLAKAHIPGGGESSPSAEGAPEGVGAREAELDGNVVEGAVPGLEQGDGPIAAHLVHELAEARAFLVELAAQAPLAEAHGVGEARGEGGITR